MQIARLRRAGAPGLALVLAIGLLAACASTNVPPIGVERPFQLARDEREIWTKSGEEQQKIEQSGKLYRDRLLEDYLAEVGQRLIPEAVKQTEAVGFRFHVIQDPTLNAFAYPNGAVYLHTGLVARLENEAQLAAVLSHELTHVTNRHTLRFLRSAQNRALGLEILGIGASIGVAAVAGKEAQKGNVEGAIILQQGANVLLGLGLQLGTLAAVNGYGRGLETEADVEGMKRLVAAGYDPKEVPKVFNLLLSTYGDESKAENFFFGNHPTNQQRLTETEHLLLTSFAEAAKEPNRRVNAEPFLARTRGLVRENAALDIKLGRYQTAQAALDRIIKATPNDARAHFYLGEIHRLDTKQAAPEPERFAKAADEYRLAITHDPAYPEPHRELGLLAYRQGQKAEARKAFETYLKLRPEADDAAVIKDYLIELGKS